MSRSPWCQSLSNTHPQFLQLSHPTVTPVILRNAGGSARKALVDLLAIDSLLSFTHVAVVRHTDCGTTAFRDGEIKEMLRGRAEKDHGGEVEGLYFGECTTSPEEMCRDEVAWLRGNLLVREGLRGRVWGGVYHVETGRVEVVA